MDPQCQPTFLRIPCLTPTRPRALGSIPQALRRQELVPCRNAALSENQQLSLGRDEPSGRDHSRAPVGSHKHCPPLSSSTMYGVPSASIYSLILTNATESMSTLEHKPRLEPRLRANPPYIYPLIALTQDLDPEFQDPAGLEGPRSSQAGTQGMSPLALQCSRSPA